MGRRPSRSLDGQCAQTEARTARRVREQTRASHPCQRERLGDRRTGLATTLSDKIHRPVEVVYNGYQPSPTPTPPRGHRDDPLLIRYTGNIWKERLPIDLFLCVKELAAAGAPVLVEFYGQKLDAVKQAAARAGVQDLVRGRRDVSHEESLRLQGEADVLLLTMAASLPGEQAHRLTVQFF